MHSRIVPAFHRRALRLQDPAAADRGAPRPWRRVAAPLLPLAGALELLSLFALVPDAFGGSPPPQPHAEWDGPNGRAPSLVRHDASGRPTPDHPTPWRH